MRRKKTKKLKPRSCEASFLKQRRKAVANGSAAAGAKCQTPGWMKGLSARLWTGKHSLEKEFNRKKYEKKKVQAFRDGTYVPVKAGQKRKLEAQVQELEKNETKRRKDYEKSIVKRPEAAVDYPKQTLVPLLAPLTPRLSASPRRCRRLLRPGLHLLADLLSML